MFDLITEIFCAVSRLKIKRTKEIPLNFGYLSIRHKLSACANGASTKTIIWRNCGMNICPCVN